MKRITLSLPSPYVGLRPFTASEALLFFGRDRHVRDLLAKLERRERFLAVLGASGTGKSSLVRAGLIPALHRGALHTRSTEGDAAPAPPQRWNVCVFQPGDAPLGQLAHALTEDERWADSSDRAVAESALATLLGGSPLALADLYRQKADRFGGEALLLVVDQFEEIFRYRQRVLDESESLVKLLLRSASEDVPIYVVITMRSDFLGNAVAFHGLAEAINGGIYLTPRLGPEEIASVITSPLALVGGSIDPVLANRLVNTLGGEDELPVLEHALLRMWDRARAHGRTSIEVEDFSSVCGTDGGAGEPMLALVIDHHASEIYDALTPFQRGVARQFFLSLVDRHEGRDVRRPRSLGELRDRVGHDAHEALMAVIEAYRAPGVGFVRPGAGQVLDAEDLIDISHESLLRRWRRLQAWLAEEDLDVAELREWYQRSLRRQEGGGTLDENDCERAQRWRARVNDRHNVGVWAADLTGHSEAYALVDRYIQASLDRLTEVKAEQEALKSAAEEERFKRLVIETQRQREVAARAVADQIRAEQEKGRALVRAAVDRRRTLFTAIAALIALGFGIVAGVFWLRANRALERANALTITAQAGELAATAESLAMSLPDLSVLLALEARRLAPSPTADGIVRAAAAAYPYRVVLRGHGGSVTAAMLSPDGMTVLTVGDDNVARLWDSNGKPLHALMGHEDDVSSARFSPDGRTIVTASADKTARLWNVADGSLLRVLRGHENELYDAEFSPDGRTVATASADATARLWDAASGMALQVLNGHEDIVTRGTFSRDGRRLATGSDDNVARLWDVRSGKALHALSGHTESITSVQFSPDDAMLVTSGADFTARLWDVVTGKPLSVLHGHIDWLRSAQFSPDGKVVLTASDDETARTWAVPGDKELRVYRGHQATVVRANWSPDGRMIVTAGEDNTARLWDAVSGVELRMLRGHEGILTDARFSPDGRTVVTASADRTARLWDVDGGSPVQTLRQTGIGNFVAHFSSDGTRVLTSGQDNSAQLWDVASGNVLRTLKGPVLPGLIGARQHGRLSPDGKTVLVTSHSSTPTLLDVETGSARSLRGHTRDVTDAAFSADSNTIITGSGDGTARLWDRTSGRELHVLRGHEGQLYGVRLSASGAQALTAGGDATARLWDVVTGSELLVLRGHVGSVGNAEFSPDGRTVVTAGADRTVRLWDTASGRELRALRGHQRELVSAEFAHDARTVLTRGNDRTVRLWDVASGRELRVLRHESLVLSAGLSPDDRTVVTTSSDNAARLWDTASGKELRVLRGHQGLISGAEFSPDGTMVLTSSFDGTARIWRCLECRTADEIAPDVARRVGRELTDDERQRFGIPSAR